MGNDAKVGFRFLFITQDDPFYVRLFFEEFFRVCTNLAEIEGVVITRAMNKRSSLELARQMAGFYGPLDFLRTGLRYTAQKVLSAGGGLLGTKASYGLGPLCKRYGVPVSHDSDINSREFLDRIQSMRLDLIISVACSVIFKAALIQAPRYGCINIHHGRLPRYRGMMPTFWQMYHGERKVGICIHEMNTRIDDGRILLLKEVDIEPSDTLDSLLKRTKRMAAHFMIEAIDRIKSGKVEYSENDRTEGSYFSYPTREEVKQFKRLGKRIL
jgi:methionyl-tRNA formyltransferase